jgi:hypothetical protein
MAMSKKHYEMIARSIREQVDHRKQAIQEQVDKTNKMFVDLGAPTPIPPATLATDPALVHLRNLVHSLNVDLSRDNPNFDGMRFVVACGF